MCWLFGVGCLYSLDLSASFPARFATPGSLVMFSFSLSLLHCFISFCLLTTLGCHILSLTVVPGFSYLYITKRIQSEMNVQNPFHSASPVRRIVKYVLIYGSFVALFDETLYNLS